MSLHVSWVRLSAGALAVVLVAAACNSSEGGQARGRGGDGTLDSANGVVVIARAPYHVAALSGAGSVRGTVQIDGAVPADSSYPVSEFSRICGGGTLTQPAAQHSGTALGEAVVWLEGVQQGKALPEDRRAELANEDCRINPRVQAVIAGTTINVGNDDPVRHTARFARLGAEQPLLTIPFTEHGQVVPSETLAREAGVIEASSKELPWARAWVAVFDHPYFAVTGADGKFTLDSVPPGSYKLKAWHPRGTEVTEVPVTVGAGSAVTDTLKVKLQ